MVYIPRVIISSILSRFPADPYLIRFRIVCKEWQSIIDDPIFAKPHHVDMFVIITNTGKLYSMPFRLTCSDTIQVKHIQHHTTVSHVTPVMLPSSCQGFFLHEPSGSQKVWALWNPFTKERLEIPPLLLDIEYVSETGLGYDAATDDYKVVLLGGRSCNDCTDSIYSTKLGSWRRIKGIRPNCHIICSAVFAYGALHWLAIVGHVEFVIISLDLTSETYRRLKLPRMSVTPDYYRLYALGGCLFLTGGPYGCSEYRWNLWILQDYGGQKVSWWNEVLTVDHNLSMCSCLVAYVKSKDQVLIKLGKNLMWFDVKKKQQLKTVAIKGIEPHFNCQVWTRSLDSLRWNSLS